MYKTFLFPTQQGPDAKVESHQAQFDNESVADEITHMQIHVRGCFPFTPPTPPRTDFDHVPFSENLDLVK